MKPSNPLINQDGFTIVEIIAVLLILGVLAAFATSRFINLQDTATERTIDNVIAELNARENLTWSSLIISSSGYTDDATLQTKVPYDLGSDYGWIDPPNETGGVLEFKGKNYTITRFPSSDTRPGIWGL